MCIYIYIYIYISIICIDCNIYVCMCIYIYIYTSVLRVPLRTLHLCPEQVAHIMARMFMMCIGRLGADVRVNVYDVNMNAWIHNKVSAVYLC